MHFISPEDYFQNSGKTKRRRSNTNQHLQSFASSLLHSKGSHRSRKQDTNQQTKSGDPIHATPRPHIREHCNQTYERLLKQRDTNRTLLPNTRHHLTRRHNGPVATSAQTLVERCQQPYKNHPRPRKIIPPITSNQHDQP